MFIKVQIYGELNKCCFDDIRKSKKPEILINTEQITSLGPTVDWSYCEGHEEYPYRVLNMTDGKGYICVAESANELERALLKQNGDNHDCSATQGDACQSKNPELLK